MEFKRRREGGGEKEERVISGDKGKRTKGCFLVKSIGSPRRAKKGKMVKERQTKTGPIKGSKGALSTT